jgi:hypothetical protein
MEALAEAAGEFRRSWKAEAKGRGVGLMPFLAATATLGLVLTRDRRAPARPDLPAPDAHSEARFSKAA